MRQRNSRRRWRTWPNVRRKTIACFVANQQRLRRKHGQVNSHTQTMHQRYAKKKLKRRLFVDLRFLVCRIARRGQLTRRLCLCNLSPQVDERTFNIYTAYCDERSMRGARHLEEHPAGPRRPATDAGKASAKFFLARWPVQRRRPRQKPTSNQHDNVCAGCLLPAPCTAHGVAMMETKRNSYSPFARNKWKRSSSNVSGIHIESATYS